MSNGNPTNPSKRDVAENMKSKAEEASREMKAKGREQLEKHESEAADTMDKMAEAGRAAARELEEGDQTMLSSYVSELANGISSLSSNLRNKNTDEIIQDVTRLARDNAGLFLLGSVAVGFGLARIAKASRSAGSHGETGRWEDYYGQQESSSYYGQPDIGQAQTGQSQVGSQEGQGTTSAMGTHASTSYLPEEGAGAERTQQSTVSAPNLESQSKPSTPSDSAGRRG